jgi:putative cyclase
VRGKAVLVETGWSRHWANEQYFEGHMYLTRDAAEYLRDEGSALVGIDSYDIDDRASVAYANSPRHEPRRIHASPTTRPKTAGRIPSSNIFRITSASLEAGQLMRDLLYEIKPLDPAVYAAVSAALLAVAAFACIVPAWRASRLDPMQALRAELADIPSPRGTLTMH